LGMCISFLPCPNIVKSSGSFKGINQKKETYIPFFDVTVPFNI
jgi:hypothetical protein